MNENIKEDNRRSQYHILDAVNDKFVNNSRNGLCKLL